MFTSSVELECMLVVGGTDLFGRCYSAGREIVFGSMADEQLNV